MVTQPAAERGRITKEQVLAEASELFKRHGYRKARLEDLGDILGVTRPALYYHFKSKQEILVEIQLRAIQGLIARINEVAHTESDDDLPLFWKLIQGHIEYVAENRVEAGIVFEEEEELPNEVREQIQTMRRRYTQRLVDAYSATVRNGEGSDIDPRLAVNTYLGAATWVYRWYHPESGLTPQQLARQMVDLLRRQSPGAVPAAAPPSRRAGKRTSRPKRP
jgi:AcrR family transcriptional regulator